MLSLVLALSLAAVDAPTPQQRDVLVLDLQPLQVEPAEAQIVTGLVAQQVVQQSGAHVLTAGDVRRVADVEAQRQAAGCNASSCLAELAEGLGVDLVVFGDLGRLGDGIVVTLQLYDAKSQLVERQVVEANSIADVPGRLPGAVAALFHKEAPSSVNATVVGGGLVAGAGAAAVVVGSIWGALLEGPLGDASADPADRESALGQRVPALATLVVGGVVLVAGGVVAGVGLAGEP